jgi:L-alanine-DL-glutamate epimerase-like enolase superfamily enzyme
MKITAIETINLEEFPNVLWVHVHTDEGIVGLGETFYAVEPVIAHIHQTIAPYLLGQNPLTIDKHSRHFLYNYLGFKSVGAEMRAGSAVDIALWDILGQVTNQPIYQLLGGATRDKVRAYNTCAGYQYVRAKSEQGTANFGMPGDGGKYQPYEDLVGFMKYADELAQSLLSEGYTGMKIWPFDEYAEASNGTYISNADLKKAMVPFEKIRAAWATRWTSTSSSIRCGTCPQRSRSPRRWSSSTRSGTRTRSKWTTSMPSPTTRTAPTCGSRPARLWLRAGASATCSRSARRACACWMWAGAAA